MKTLYLVDIFSFIFRAYYAIRPLSASDGTPVNALYGVATMIHKLIEGKKPDHLIVCADSKEKNFRYGIFPEYKANRSAPPEDLIPQIDLVWEFLQAYPIPVAAVSGFEADDVIATLVEKYSKDPEMQIFIVSTDKDLMQLVGKNVFMYDTMKEKISSFPEVLEKFGVTPDKVVDVQSLCGDPTDNVPGIPGVGPKTATKLIQDYGSVENVLAHANELKGKLAEKVADNRELALLSKKLVSLARDVPIDLNWNDLALPKPNHEKLNAFYQRMNFKSLVKNQSSHASSATDLPKNEMTFVTVNTAQDLEKLVKKITAEKLSFSFDTETTDLNTQKAEIVGFSFCFDEQEAYYVPLAHKAGDNLDKEIFIKLLGPVLKNPGIAKMAQNAKFDIKVLHSLGLPVSGLTGDTLIASYLLNPDGSHSLDYLAEKFLNHKMIAFSDVVKKGETFADVAIDKATAYSAEDAWAAFCLNQKLNAQLEEKNLTDIYQTLEIPLIDVLTQMEEDGILVDQKLLDDLEKEFAGRIAALEKSIYQSAGQEFNINSPKQLQEILFVKLGLPTQRKTKTGFSTDVDVLEALVKHHELPRHLLEYRTLSKLLSTYVVQLKNMIDPKTGRVHTHFNQTIAATGRLSSTEPNLQNIPIKTEEGRRIREVFVAKTGCVLLSADYSQIELRLLAAFTGDKHLKEAYQNDEDIHAKTASVILGIPLHQITTEQRALGKTINFGVVYGQSPFGLAGQLGIPQSEAKHFIDSFYKEFASVKSYKDQILEDAKKQGFVTTHLGRKRFLPELASQNFMMRQNAERVAFNTVFQGSSADLIKKAMIAIHARLQKENYKTKMLLQVHDELVFEVPKAELDDVKVWIPQLMSNAFTLNVPLKVSFKTGRTWGEAH